MDVVSVLDLLLERLVDNVPVAVDDVELAVVTGDPGVLPGLLDDEEEISDSETVSVLVRVPVEMVSVLVRVDVGMVRVDVDMVRVRDLLLDVREVEPDVPVAGALGLLLVCEDADVLLDTIERDTVSVVTYVEVEAVPTLDWLTKAPVPV